MKPIALLMIEHRLIEKAAGLIAKRALDVDKTSAIDLMFVEKTVDFFRSYADRTHHGKEEDILFVEMRKKQLPPDLKRIMEELIAEHIVARKTVGAYLEAGRRVASGDKSAARELVTQMKTLSSLYPPHIEKEDRHFFFPVMELFTQAEQDKMLKDFLEFDQKVIHEKYQKMVKEL